jgi:hypothetical protein
MSAANTHVRSASAMRGRNAICGRYALGHVTAIDVGMAIRSRGFQITAVERGGRGFHHIEGDVWEGIDMVKVDVLIKVRLPI